MSLRDLGIQCGCISSHSTHPLPPPKSPYPATNPQTSLCHLTRDKFLLSASQHCGIEIKYLNWSILLCQDTANQPFTNFSFRSRALSITFFHQTKNIKRLMSTHARNKTLYYFFSTTILMITIIKEIRV